MKGPENRTDYPDDYIIIDGGRAVPEGESGGSLALPEDKELRRIVEKLIM